MFSCNKVKEIRYDFRKDIFAFLKVKEQKVVEVELIKRFSDLAF
jgi:hypothetical protein